MSSFLESFDEITLEIHLPHIACTIELALQTEKYAGSKSETLSK